ncbi:glycogenin-1 [Trichonephila inaurata madagascariensis]|uniref:glycogenin glucosyltransferase n=1 Tax=Trichonephila inaurata madagascariensis TaxID=2747483 RepID=A0A8X6YSD6_9ARAC|nr:glycogenin-1 [Trichonephila inaurata madagascariensis]
MDQENVAFVTLATDDFYGSGALVLANSLKLVETKAKLVVLVTTGISVKIRDQLCKIFDLVEEVHKLDSNDGENLALLQRPELGVTLTKLYCWKLTQFSKCVFLDADTLVLKNCDELFEKSELSAVPDVGWPDCFNSGVFVFKPSIETFEKLKKLAAEEGSFDGGDQGLLNTYFSDWSTSDISRHLSFIYNMNINMCYTYLPAYHKFGGDVKIVHFLGNQKPWMFHYNKDTGSIDAPHSSSAPLSDYLKMWWKIFNEHVSSKENGPSIAEQLERMTLSSRQASICSPTNFSEFLVQDRLSEWEQGRIDYLGQDSYDKIEKKLDEAILGPKK